jgi:hypothetical protein
LNGARILPITAVAENGCADVEGFEVAEVLEERPSVGGIAVFPVLIELGALDFERERPRDTAGHVEPFESGERSQRLDFLGGEVGVDEVDGVQMDGRVGEVVQPPNRLVLISENDAAALAENPFGNETVVIVRRRAGG